MDVSKEWGGYSIIDRGPGYLTKRLWVSPGQHTSLQRHSYRKEVWTIVGGFGSVVVDKEVHVAGAGSVFEVGVGVVHQIRCDKFSPTPLTMIEVWLGAELSEEDIERFMS